MALVQLLLLQARQALRRLVCMVRMVRAGRDGNSGSLEAPGPAAARLAAEAATAAAAAAAAAVAAAAGAGAGTGAVAGAGAGAGAESAAALPPVCAAEGVASFETTMGAAQLEVRLAGLLCGDDDGVCSDAFHCCARVDALGGGGAGCGGDGCVGCVLRRELQQREACGGLRAGGADMPPEGEQEEELRQAGGSGVEQGEGQPLRRGRRRTAGAQAPAAAGAVQGGEQELLPRHQQQHTDPPAAKRARRHERTQPPRQAALTAVGGSLPSKAHQAFAASWLRRLACLPLGAPDPTARGLSNTSYWLAYPEHQCEVCGSDLKLQVRAAACLRILSHNQEHACVCVCACVRACKRACRRGQGRW